MTHDINTNQVKNPRTPQLFSKSTSAEKLGLSTLAFMRQGYRPYAVVNGEPQYRIVTLKTVPAIHLVVSPETGTH